MCGFHQRKRSYLSLGLRQPVESVLPERNTSRKVPNIEGSTRMDGRQGSEKESCLLDRQVHRDVLLGSLQTRLNSAQLIVVLERDGIQETELRPCVHDGIRKCTEPGQHRLNLALEDDLPPPPLDQACRALKIGGSQGMLHGFSNKAMLFVPDTGTTVKFWHQLGFGLCQTMGEHFGKQVVVAVPLPLVIQGDHK